MTQLSVNGRAVLTPYVQSG